MAHLRSKHTLSVSLSNSPPETDELYVSTYALQGNTVVTFILSGIQTSSLGIQGIYINNGIGNDTIFYPAAFSDRLTLNLPFTSINFTYYQTASAPDILSASFGVLYQPVNGNKPLSATHIVELFVSAENVLDKNLELINTQIFTVAGGASFLFNLETDENIVYPVALFEPLTFVPFLGTGVYLNTDPETDLESEIPLLSALSASNIINTEQGERITVI